MPNIAVAPEQLLSVSGRLNLGASSVESTLTWLEGRVAPLRSECEGLAQARFEGLWAGGCAPGAGSKGALHGISQLTRQAAANYEEAETAARSGR